MKTKIIQTLLIYIIITMSGFACLFSPAVQGEINPAKENGFMTQVMLLIGLTRSSTTTSSSGNASGGGVTAPSNLTYTGSPYTFTNGSPIATQTPTVTGTITNCSSSPTLPTGLSINTTTCAMSGTPTVNQAATSYTITASNSAGSTSAIISITISSTAPSNLVYSGSPFTFTNGTAIATQTPTMTGTATSCVSSPTLPTGLILNATSCAISGTPTVNQGATSYTITASNSFGNTTRSISITVNMAAPSNLVYSGSPFTFTNGSAITTQTPTVTGTVTGCSSSPTLPTGLIINATTCAISGTPTVNQGANSYTITASNSSGNTTRLISISVNTVTPVGTPATASGSGIAQSTQIVITFNRSMNTSSLSLTGLMASESNAGVWSTVINTNDKLTVTATTSWTVGSNRTITINCNDTIGTPMTTLNLSYGVLDGNVYVKTTGNDSNPGTQTQPKLTIQAAINLADALYTTANVRVAQGTYNESITITNDISLYGGYSNSNWGLRDSTIYESIIATGSIGVTMSAGITAQTIWDGFKILVGTDGTVSTGLYIDSVSPIIRNNTIIASSSATLPIGILVQYGAAVIYNNIINGGSGIYTRGINVGNNAAPIIRNNTINGGNSSGNNHAIYLGSSSSPVIENNIIFTSGGNGYCIFENLGNPVSIRNNNLYNCSVALYKDDTNGNLTSIVNVNNYTKTTQNVSYPSSNNISVNPNFLNQAGGDYHLTTSSPTSVTQGGLDLSAFFTTDKDGVTRTAPWSIGAYEY